MYVPAHFAADDTAVRDLLLRHGAGDLVTLTEAGLVATLLPFVHDPDDGPHGALLGHVARNNDQWRARPRGRAPPPPRRWSSCAAPTLRLAVLVREQGRARPGRPDVELRDRPRVRPGDVARRPGFVEDVVRRLTALHEAALHADPAGSVVTAAGVDPDRPWTVDDAPRAFVEGQLRAVVGVRVEITRVEAKLKLSQNRPAADAAGVVAGLAGRGDDASADAVRAAAARR